MVNENNLTPTQKKNRRVDEYKNEWALKHCIPIMRIWEYDIRNEPEKVMNAIKERLHIINVENGIKNNKNKRHVNRLTKKNNGSNNKNSA